MKHCRSLLRSIFVSGLVLAATVVSFSQPEVRQVLEPSSDISLQLLIGSNGAVQGSDVPANLSAISKQVKGTFGFQNLRLASTLLGRISNTGSFEYKSLTNIFGQETNLASQTFMDWSIGDVRSMPTAKGTPGFQAQKFRFGARVPVTTGTVKDEAGKMIPSVSYEQIGIAIGKMGLSENTPTLIGTLNLPGAGGTIFLVMTVRLADM